MPHYQNIFVQRHNAMLRSIDTFARPFYKNKTVIVDLPRNTMSQIERKKVDDMEKYLLGGLRKRPDVIVVDHETQIITLAEVTCCLPKNMPYWAHVKTQKYKDLVERIQDKTLTRTVLWTLEFGTDGQWSESVVPFFRQTFPQAFLD